MFLWRAKSRFHAAAAPSTDHREPSAGLNIFERYRRRYLYSNRKPSLVLLHFAAVIAGLGYCLEYDHLSKRARHNIDLLTEHEQHEKHEKQNDKPKQEQPVALTEEPEEDWSRWFKEEEAKQR